ncbi:MAG: ABC transporter ATP-binding protein [Clostridia bacterium]
MDNKEKTPYTIWSNLRFLLRRTWSTDKGLLFSVLLKTPSLVALPLLTTYLSKLVVELVVQGASPLQLFVQTAGVIAGMLLFHLLNNYTSAKIEWESFGNRFSYIHLTSQKAMDADYANIESPHGQTMLRRALDSVYTAQSGVQQIFNQFVSIASNTVGLITYSALILTLSPWILACLLCFSLISYAVQRMNNNWMHRHKDDWVPLERKLQYISNKSGDYTIGKDAKIYSMYPWFRDLFRRLFTERQRWYRRQEGRNFIAGLLNIALTVLRDGIAYWYLIQQVVNGYLSAGDFVFYFAIISQYSGWLFGIIGAMGSLHASSLSLCDLRCFLDMPDQFNRGPGHELPSSTCSITYSHVSFSYNGQQENAVLRDINFTIHKGEKVAIVGLNGAGKTTLIKLLCGLYHPSAGTIAVDGVPIDEYNRDAYYSLFSVVFQDIILMPISFAKNIALCEEERIDYARLTHVLKLAGLYDKVQSLPEQERTLLMKSMHENSIELSGGEQQKLALARALYKNGQIIVLDEPTAALDPIAENEMYRKYHELTAGRTAIFISHRLSSTRFCDRILYLENGQIAETGTHDELLRKNGKYAALFRTQSQYYEGGGGADEEVQTVLQGNS